MSNGGCKNVSYLIRLFYCSIVDYEVTGGSGVRFPADASDHKPNLFHWGLTIEFRDIGFPTVTFVLLNSSASFRPEDT